MEGTIMKSHINYKSLEVPHDKLIKIVKSQFQEFLKYINYPQIEFPNCVELQFYNGLNKGTEFRGQLHVPNNSNNNYTLALEQIDCLQPSREVLFHEFVHIMDYLILNNHLSFEDKLEYLNEFSEIRATYYEYLIRANISTNNTHIKLNENSDVFSGFKYKSLKLSDEIFLYQSNISNLIKNFKIHNASCYYNNTKQLCYYIGFILFLEKHSNIIVDTYISSLTEQIMTIWGTGITALINIRQIVPLDFFSLNIDTLKIIKKSFNLSKDFYIQKYINQ